MIVLNVTYRCKPGMRDAFLQQLTGEGLDAACRAEAGNIKYDYYIPCVGGDELLLVEKWLDADALDAHKQLPHFARIGQVKEGYVLETLIERFEA